MTDLYEPFPLRHAVIDGRNIWTYQIKTTVGDFYVTEYEKPYPDCEIADAYLGRSGYKADRAFDATAAAMLKGKK